MSQSLHPQNDRVGDEGIGDAIMEYLNYYRFPPKYITADDGVMHETPLCPEVIGTEHRTICHEEAIYVSDGRCEVCQFYRTDVGDSWTDPRFEPDDDGD